MNLGHRVWCTLTVSFAQLSSSEEISIVFFMYIETGVLKMTAKKKTLEQTERSFI